MFEVRFFRQGVCREVWVGLYTENRERERERENEVHVIVIFVSCIKLHHCSRRDSYSTSSR